MGFFLFFYQELVSGPNPLVLAELSISGTFVQKFVLEGPNAMLLLGSSPRQNSV